MVENTLKEKINNIYVHIEINCL